MNNYFSTFIPGLGEFITEQIKKDLGSVEISLLLDGLIIYQSTSPAEEVKHLRSLNNSFQLINQHNGLGEIRPLESMVTDFIDGQHVIPIGQGKSFREMYYYANTPVAIDKMLHEQMENRILDTARMTGKKLTINRTNPDFEYWFLYRKEGYGFLGLRLTKHPDYKGVLVNGQLRPELVNVMVLLSNPQKDDIVLDPFAGSGTISIERAKYPYRKIIASDINSNKTTINVKKSITAQYWSNYAQVKQKYAQRYTMDALEMKEINDRSVDKIITDPPWGIYSAIGNIDTFYVKTVKEMVRVLKPGGLIVMLAGRNIDVSGVLTNYKDNLELQKQYNILVSGKKAGIFVVKKIV